MFITLDLFKSSRYVFNSTPIKIDINFCKIYLQVYWAGPMIGGGLGAFIYDRIFSTRSMLRSGGSKEGKEFNKMGMSKEVYINEASSIEHSEL